MTKTTSKEYQTLRSSIDSKIDLSSATNTFIDPIRKSVSKNSPESDLENSLEVAWKALVEVAADLPHATQEPLVEILRSIQKQDLATDREVDTAKLQIWGERVNVFQDLPLLGSAVRNAWNRTPGTGSTNDFTPEQWVNLNSFVARLTSLSSSASAFDFSLYAIWVLRPALEESSPKASDIDAAKVWFRYANELIETLSQQGKSFEGRLARPGGKYEQKGWTGFNAERLKVWQEALL